MRGSLARSRLAALGLLAGLAAGLPGATLAEEPLTGREIAARIVGNTVRGGDAAFEEYYRPDGAVFGTSPEGSYQGRWTIDDDRLCLEYAEPFGCHQIVLEGEKITFINEDGDVDDAGTLLPGNPNGFGGQ